MKAMYQEVTSDDQIALQLAHDIASPLSVMQLNIGFIKDMLPAENLVKLQAAINQIREITHSALNRKNNAATIDLQVVVQQLILEKKYAWKNHACSIDLIAQTGATKFTIQAARADIYRVLSDLLNNAYDSLRDKRKISVSLDQIDQQIVLSIHDSGCGISENAELNSARQYMKLIGGNLTMRSGENGTEVQLFFPK